MTNLVTIENGIKDTPFVPMITFHRYTVCTPSMYTKDIRFPLIILGVHEYVTELCRRDERNDYGEGGIAIETELKHQVFIVIRRKSIRTQIL